MVGSVRSEIVPLKCKRISQLYREGDSPIGYESRS